MAMLILAKNGPSKRKQLLPKMSCCLTLAEMTYGLAQVPLLYKLNT